MADECNTEGCTNEQIADWYVCRACWKDKMDRMTQGAVYSDSDLDEEEL